MPEIMSSTENLAYQLGRFGQRVKDIRKHRKLTLVAIEKEIGISNSKLSKIENGLVNMEFNTIVRIAGALQVGIIDLFDYDGPLPKAK